MKEKHFFLVPKQDTFLDQRRGKKKFYEIEQKFKICGIETTADGKPGGHGLKRCFDCEPGMLWHRCAHECAASVTDRCVLRRAFAKASFAKLDVASR